MAIVNQSSVTKRDKEVLRFFIRRLNLIWSRFLSSRSWPYLIILLKVVFPYLEYTQAWMRDTYGYEDWSWSATSQQCIEGCMRLLKLAFYHFSNIKDDSTPRLFHHMHTRSYSAIKHEFIDVAATERKKKVQYYVEGCESNYELRATDLCEGGLVLAEDFEKFLTTGVYSHLSVVMCCGRAHMGSGCLTQHISAFVFYFPNRHRVTNDQRLVHRRCTVWESIGRIGLRLRRGREK